MKEKKHKNMVEITFNSEKEKVFVFLNKFLTITDYTNLLKILGQQDKTKVFFLPKEWVDSVTVIREGKPRWKRRKSKKK